MAKARKKTKVPKRLGGVKVPKTVRRGLKGLAASQNGRTVIAEALAAAGAAIIASQARSDSTTRNAIRTRGPQAKAALRGKLSEASEARHALGSAFEAAMDAFAKSLRGTPSETLTPDTPTH